MGLVKVTYFDTAMALIEIGGIRLLTDPVLDGAGSHYELGPVHLEKTGASAATLSSLGRLDAVILSHDQHSDNLDSGGRALLSTVPAVITTPDGASRLKDVSAKGLTSWEKASIQTPNGEALEITAVPARHGPAGSEAIVGPVTGFVLDWVGNSSGLIYVSGDTVPFDGTDEIARRYAPVGLALLNLGKAQLDITGDMTFTMSAQEAAKYAAALGAKRIVPLHFDGWRHFSEDRSAAEAAFRNSPVSDRVHWLESGATVVFEF